MCCACGVGNGVCRLRLPLTRGCAASPPPAVGHLHPRPQPHPNTLTATQVEGNKVVPADCLFLRSFPREGADGGTPSICYVQTAQLDGETNLKLRQMKQSVVDLFASDAMCGAFDGCVKAAKPSQKFSDLNAKLQFRGREWLPNAGPEEQVSLKEKDQLLLRGVVLKNVGHVYALVLYTGEQTKVRVAQGVNNVKVASVEAVINRNILYLVAVLVGLCIIGAVGYTVETNELREDHWYLHLDDPSFGDVLAKVGTFFLLDAAMVPISLYVTMKMARTVRPHGGCWCPPPAPTLGAPTLPPASACHPRWH